jgi:hypothetical protein
MVVIVPAADVPTAIRVAAEAGIAATLVGEVVALADPADPAAVRYVEGPLGSVG